MDFPSFLVRFAIELIALASCPLFPSVISMLYMIVLKGISIEADSFFYKSEPLSKLYKLNDIYTDGSFIYIYIYIIKVPRE